MRIPLFAHDADVRVSEPLCYKGRDQIVQMLGEGSIKVLRDSKGREWAAQFENLGPERTLASQLEHYLSISSSAHSVREVEELLLDSSVDSTTGITDDESKANAGIVDSRMQGLEGALILRARNKVAAWPQIRDDRNISVSGARWA